MGSYGEAPAAVAVPDGFVLVGYRCTAPGHDCLVPIADMEPCGGGLVLGPNHHASWAPVFELKDPTD